MPGQPKIIPPGTRFGYWTVLGSVFGHGKGQHCDCVCDCGTRRLVVASRLTSGGSRSCGCKRGEFIAANGRARPDPNANHRKPEYGVWMHMRERCRRPNSVAYRHYGGRGIAVCERWQESFEAFYEDMGPRPSPEHSLERIDNDGPYSPENCRWATREEQAHNRRATVRVTFRGETLALSEWAARVGLPYRLVRARYYLGWPVERILTEPAYGYKAFDEAEARRLYEEEGLTVTEIAARFRLYPPRVSDSLLRSGVRIRTRAERSAHAWKRRRGAVG